ncbi:MAG: putative DNA binding domain-containing protein [Bacteroidetes bacterium]|nr:putative DNA binding domain-containing protein [Bacteroidota bacterium]MCY4234006.1 putative DNA binding domain-containing protein [Bacteroidota bacterium]
MERLTDSELENLLTDIESDRVERKRSFGKSISKTARQAVCAFANDIGNHNLPGLLFIGAEDDGSPSNLSVSDDLLRNLSDMKTDGNILPLPVLTVEKRLLNGAEMAIVTVMPSDMPPVKYDGRIWIRTGPRRSIANQQEERILNEKRRKKNLPFDLSKIPLSRISDLSQTIFINEYLPAAFAEDVLTGNQRTYEERLASCKFTVSPTDTTPSLVGLLSIGKVPQDFLWGAYIQFLRIDGLELSDPVIDECKAEGSIVQMLNRVEEKLMAHNRTAIDVTSGPVHNREFIYPPAALQQILYNAVLHRSYEDSNAPVRVYWFNDRIEITSPGGPYGDVTPENFGTSGITDYRNPNLCDVLKTFGFVQAFGRGIDIARRAMKKNGNPEIQFEVNHSVVLCVLPAKT